MALKHSSCVRVGTEARGRLAEYGLAGPALMRAVLEGFSRARSRENDLDIPQARGFARYNDVVVMLRTLLMPAWEMVNSMPRILESGKLGVSIALYFGDECTGLADCTPSNAHKKGQAMAEMVDQNQGELFPEFEVPAPAASERATTWVLLIRAAGGKLRGEFSLPCAYDDEGFIVDWTERIILGELDLPRGGAQVFPTPTGPIDIDVVPI